MARTTLYGFDVPIGLRLNKIGRTAEVVDTPATRGMIAKVAHLVEVVEK